MKMCSGTMEFRVLMYNQSLEVYSKSGGKMSATTLVTWELGDKSRVDLARI